MSALLKEIFLSVLTQYSTHLSLDMWKMTHTVLIYLWLIWIRTPFIFLRSSSKLEPVIETRSRTLKVGLWASEDSVAFTGPREGMVTASFPHHWIRAIWVITSALEKLSWDCKGDADRCFSLLCNFGTSIHPLINQWMPKHPENHTVSLGLLARFSFILSHLLQQD